MFLFPSLQPEIRLILDSIPALIDKTFPLPGRFRSSLPADVAELSRLLTSARGERSLSYLGRPNLLSAYIRYFLPWNLYRLCRLLPNLDLPLAAGDVITDLGCGPLTMEAALWISRPDLRTVPLEFRCVDQSGPVLDAGKIFFAALSGALSAALPGRSPWNIHTIKKRIEHPSIREKPAALVCAVNVCNEVFGDALYSDINTQRIKARQAARFFHSLASPSASILAVEPGIPGSGQFISLLRSAFLEHQRLPVSPCPHAAACPMPGGFSVRDRKRGKNRWCHFAFDTEDAPKVLHKLSAKAGIPKERAVLCFLLTGPVKADALREETMLRVISDSFPLPENRFGRYCCSGKGLVLLTGGKSAIEKSASGALIAAQFPAEEQRDAKSGALIVCEGYMPRPLGRL